MFLMALTLMAVELAARPMDVEVVRDLITDEVRAYATIREGRDRLVVSCAPAEYDGARVAFHSHRWLARGNIFTGGRPVTYRFDNLPPRRMMWDVNDRRGLLTGNSRVAAFLSGLVGSERLVIRARDIENRRFDMVFRLVDVAPALRHALAACRSAGAGGGELPDGEENIPAAAR